MKPLHNIIFMKNHYIFDQTITIAYYISIELGFTKFKSGFSLLHRLPNFGLPPSLHMN